MLKNRETIQEGDITQGRILINEIRYLLKQILCFENKGEGIYFVQNSKYSRLFSGLRSKTITKKQGPWLLLYAMSICDFSSLKGTIILFLTEGQMASKIQFRPGGDWILYVISAFHFSEYSIKWIFNEFFILKLHNHFNLNPGLHDT